MKKLASLIVLLLLNGCGEIIIGNGSWTTPEEFDVFSSSQGNNSHSKSFGCSENVLSHTSGSNSDSYASGGYCN